MCKINILVLDVAAESSGALTILNEFYAEFSTDSENMYFLCVSKVELESNLSVKILSFPWVKRSWFHRLWFELVTVRSLIKRYAVGEVYSLQNVLPPRIKQDKKLYLQLTLPFTDHKFNLLKEPIFWVYQHIIGRMIKMSARSANKVIVQTEWFKNKLAQSCKIPLERIIVKRPTVKVDNLQLFDDGKWNHVFFYPATPQSYKNHFTLLKAMDLLRVGGVCDYKVVLTLHQNELPNNCRVYFERNKDNLQFLGSIPYDEAMAYYSQSVLVFPSLIESFGLPLIEASACKAPVLVADEEYSREILESYDKCWFFDALNAKELSILMLDMLQKKHVGSLA